MISMSSLRESGEDMVLENCLSPPLGTPSGDAVALRGKQEVCLQIYMEVLLLFQKLAEPRVPADFQLAIQFSLIW